MSASLAVPAKVNEIGGIAPGRGERLQCHSVAATVSTQGAITTSQADAAEASNTAQFAREQIQALIQRVFFPGWPKASRQVVISGADAQSNTSGVCARIAREMAAGLPGTVCAVEADMRSPGLAELLVGGGPKPPRGESGACILAHQNLWLAEVESLCSGENDGFSAVWLRTRLSELRRNFDYTLIHAPAAFLTQTIVLGQLADGLVLVIQAGKTHRVVAQTTLASLKAAKVAVLGTVLIDRTFPIPEELYHRL